MNATCSMIEYFFPPSENKKKFPREVTRGIVNVHGAMLFWGCMRVCVCGFVGVVVVGVLYTVYLSCHAPEEASVFDEWFLRGWET